MVLKLDAPIPYLIKAFAAAESPIVPKHIYDGTDPFTNTNNVRPIGTGPFRFKEWVRGSYVIYERNADYWDQPRPYLDQLIVKFIPDAAARSAALESGEIDLGYRTPVALQRRGAAAHRRQARVRDQGLRVQQQRHEPELQPGQPVFLQARRSGRRSATR